ncbi:hypothetical protein D3C75_203630 [compost metagenome]
MEVIILLFLTKESICSPFVVFTIVFTRVNVRAHAAFFGLNIDSLKYNRNIRRMMNEWVKITNKPKKWLITLK